MRRGKQGYEFGGVWEDQLLATNPLEALKVAERWLLRLEKMAKKAEKSGGSRAIDDAIARQKKFIDDRNKEISAFVAKYMEERRGRNV